MTWPAFFNPKNWPSPMKGFPCHQQALPRGLPSVSFSSSRPCIPTKVDQWLFLYSVNPLASEKKISIFWQNKRFLSFVDTENGGRVAQFLVGATCVGSVSFTADLPRTVGKGDEFGYFSFGGSSVLTLFEEGKVTQPGSSGKLIPGNRAVCQNGGSEWVHGDKVTTLFL